ncbi:hypothetical protein CEXT_516271 [Caerostris extrusa]|uniref:Uncharacterized protein n=1 Tax=Caerostris extrusa TaxID=172846 RepID=A0AAV4NAD5_CAEEX|nr:hypothetical protein CEXT_516271 [Caerostris extrusa]
MMWSKTGDNSHRNRIIPTRMKKVADLIFMRGQNRDNSHREHNYPYKNGKNYSYKKGKKSLIWFLEQNRDKTGISLQEWITLYREQNYPYKNGKNSLTSFNVSFNVYGGKQG